MARYAAFKAHKKSSVKAHGSVSEVRLHEDGKTARVTVRHQPPKKKAKATKDNQAIGLGMDDYPQETSATMPAEHAKRFTVGQKVAVHMGPAEEMGDMEGSPAEEAGESDAEEQAEQPSPKRAGNLIRAASAKRSKA